MTIEQFRRASRYAGALQDVQAQIDRVEKILSFPRGLMMTISFFSKIRIFSVTDAEDIKVFNHTSGALLREILEKHLACLKEEEARLKAMMEEI